MPPETTGPVVRARGIEQVLALVGQQLGPTDWRPVTQPMVDAFADITDDHQWIHIDPLRAVAGPFGVTIAHGLLTLSLVPALLAKMLVVDEVRMGINYGMNRVRFPAPVRVGSRIRARATIDSAEPVGDGAVQVVATVVVETEDGDKPACVAELVFRYYA
jgi:acyl dehydratase